MRVPLYRRHPSPCRYELQIPRFQITACYGLDRQGAGALFEDFATSAGFMDLHWPGICIVEMKAPRRDVSIARAQMVRYWQESADDDGDVPAARWVVLCNFHTFEVWEPGRLPGRPRAIVDLADLPDRYDVLLFLAGPTVESVFVEHHREHPGGTEGHRDVPLPRRPARRTDRRAATVRHAGGVVPVRRGPRHARRLAAAVDRQAAARGAWALVGRRDRLPVRVLNQKGSHNRRDLLAGTTYVNGELFAQPAEVDLDRDELRLLLEASAFDWRRVDPTIFGSLMEGVLGHDRR